MSSVITREQLLQQPQNQYMSPDQLAFFRNYLHDVVRETLDRIDSLKLSLTESVRPLMCRIRPVSSKFDPTTCVFFRYSNPIFRPFGQLSSALMMKIMAFVSSRVRRLAFSAFSFLRLRPCQQMRNLSSSVRTNTELHNSNSQS